MPWSDDSSIHRGEQKGQTNMGRSKKNKQKKKGMKIRWENKQSRGILYLKRKHQQDNTTQMKEKLREKKKSNSAAPMGCLE